MDRNRLSSCRVAPTLSRFARLPSLELTSTLGLKSGYINLSCALSFFLLLRLFLLLLLLPSVKTLRYRRDDERMYAKKKKKEGEKEGIRDDKVLLIE